ncbi:hypothetical protein HMPREF0281_00314 [Corynebacterium ammoniagenes DSM 20306]|uniref:Uncharacterized protein n=1 Tax=Corynebacterium ammoniagenes DSM 20306 TaxID=649754 RepID=A0ABP2IMD7_CORAM|nr:hypothetical protein HMPREF0281_00314 [Corynebacterium ammoniagenes DSM 20306]
MQPLPRASPCVDSARDKLEEDMNGPSLLAFVVPSAEGGQSSSTLAHEPVFEQPGRNFFVTALKNLLASPYFSSFAVA